MLSPSSRATLLVLGLAWLSLASTGHSKSAILDGTWIHGSTIKMPSRTLKQSEGTSDWSAATQRTYYAVKEIPEYLIPSEDTLCTGANCCNHDYNASPYRLQHLNHTTTLSLTGARLTTYYLSLYSDAEGCMSTPGAINDCCTSNITKLWVDVDPLLKVKYASFNGQTANAAFQQDQFGFHMMPMAGSLMTVPSSGLLLTITVEGSAPALCPTADYLLGTEGISACQAIVLGSTAHTSNACCPYSLAKTMEELSSPYVPEPPQCSDAIGSSPFSLSLNQVSVPFTAPNGLSYANYTFVLFGQNECDASAINSCCSMALSSIDISIMRGVTVQQVIVDGRAHAQVEFLESNSPTHQTMALTQLALPSNGVPSYGTSIVVTVAVPASSSVPNLCQATPAAPGTVGACDYVLHATEASSGMCCPSSETGSVVPGTVPDGSCHPAKSASLDQTRMDFSYYQGPTATSASTTSFSFLVSNEALPCTAQYCDEVCNWQLLINPSIASQLTFRAEALFSSSASSSPSSNGGAILTYGPDASVTFTQAPPANGGALLYTITIAKAGATLQDLCRPGSVAGQGSDPCGAVVRNAVVNVPIAFSQEDVVPSPLPPLPDSCLNPKPMPQSCVRVNSAGYNMPSGSASTLLDFEVGNHDGEAGCTPEDAVMQFQVLLSPPAGLQLQQTNAIMPTAADISRDGTSITWRYTPAVAGSVIHYQMGVQGAQTPSTICQQNVLPGQPASTCAVLFHAPGAGCYAGFIAVPNDPNLGFIAAPKGDSSGVSAAVIVPAVLIPLVALAALVGAALWYRRRKMGRSAAMGGGGLLSTPLHSGSGSVSGSDASASGIHIRLPTSS